uniref:Uncharacterized protein n=1 Tax=Arundo donax TaxID=35708 RepID=A0A0A9EK83_ARUDO
MLLLWIIYACLPDRPVVLIGGIVTCDTYWWSGL